MSLLLAYTFNDNNVSSFADFSGNKLTGSGTIGSIVAGQNYGYAASFSATNNYITVTPANFASATNFCVFASIYLTSLPGTFCYLANQAGSFNIQINSTGHVVFNIQDSNPIITDTVTSAGTLSTGAWHTVACVSNGTNIYIYIDGVQDTNTTTNTGIGLANAALYIGNDTSGDTSHTFAGKIDCIEFRSGAMSENDIVNLNASPGGLLISNTSHNFATGDLLLDVSNNNEAVVTWVVDAGSFYCYPILGQPVSYTRIGNIYQTARQYFMQQSNDFDSNGNGQISTQGPISGFADYGTNTITFDYRGITSPNLIANMRAIAYTKT